MTAPQRLRFDIRQARRPLAAALVTLAALEAAFWAGFVRPRGLEYAALTQENNPRLQQLRERQAEVERLEAYVKGLEQAQADLQHLRHEVLATRASRMVEVQAELDQLCRTFGIDLDLVSYDHPQLAAEQLEVMRMSVPLEGGYEALRKFLEAVESSHQFMIVEDVSLGQGKEGGAVLQLNITLGTYFDVPEGRALTTAPAPGRRRS